MKKLLLFSIFVCALCSVATAQTYYYKITSKVNPKTGVRSNYSGSLYITFTNNMSYCYESDKNGNELYNKEYLHPNVSAAEIYFGLKNIYQYVQYKDGMHIYACYYKSAAMSFSGPSWVDGYKYVYFSNDRKKVNIDLLYSDDILVGELATPPGQASAPTQMW